ncbi:MAG: FHA domain-containing protein [Spirochaetia bacterium]
MNKSEWYLQGHLPDNSPWIVPIYKSIFKIGRDVDSDLILSTAGVSRRHARLHIVGGELYIEDSGSRNGTYLNGTQIEGRTPVYHNDTLQVGGYEFTFRYRRKANTADQTQVVSREEKQGDFAKKYGLSEREEEVLFLLLRGKRIQEIGEKLFISPGTAKLHTQNIYKKTGCHSRIELLSLYRGPLESG